MPFHIIDDASVVLYSKGRYYQAKVVRRGDALYAKQGNAFIKLYAWHKGTSVPTISWSDLHVEFEVWRGDGGELIVPMAKPVGWHVVNEAERHRSGERRLRRVPCTDGLCGKRHQRRKD